MHNLAKLIYSIDLFLLQHEYKTRLWVDDSGATVLEWRTIDTIIGIAIEKNPEDSGWFFARSVNNSRGGPRVQVALSGKLNEEFETA